MHVYIQFPKDACIHTLSVSMYTTSQCMFALLCTTWLNRPHNCNVETMTWSNSRWQEDSGQKDSGQKNHHKEDCRTAYPDSTADFAEIPSARVANIAACAHDIQTSPPTSYSPPLLHQRVQRPEAGGELRTPVSHSGNV